MTSIGKDTTKYTIIQELPAYGILSYSMSGDLEGTAGDGPLQNLRWRTVLAYVSKYF